MILIFRSVSLITLIFFRFFIFLGFSFRWFYIFSIFLRRLSISSLSIAFRFFFSIIVIIIFVMCRLLLKHWFKHFILYCKCKMFRWYFIDVVSLFQTFRDFISCHIFGVMPIDFLACIFSSLFWLPDFFMINIFLRMYVFIFNISLSISPIFDVRSFAAFFRSSITIRHYRDFRFRWLFSRRISFCWFWFIAVFSIFASFLSDFQPMIGRYYFHYFLMLMPAAAFIFGRHFFSASLSFSCFIFLVSLFSCDWDFLFFFFFDFWFADYYSWCHFSLLLSFLILLYFRYYFDAPDWFLLIEVFEDFSLISILLIFADIVFHFIDFLFD